MNERKFDIITGLGIALYFALAAWVIFGNRASAADLPELVSEAWASNLNTPAEIMAWLSDPIPVGTNVVQVARNETLIYLEAQMNAIATNYVPQAQLSMLPATTRILAVDAAVNAAANAATGDAKTIHVSNGLNLLKLKSITESLGGGLGDPYYRQASYPVTNITTATRWEIHQGTNAFPTAQQILEALQP